MSQKILSIFGMLFVLIGMSACDQTPRRSDKILVVGTSGDNPPFEFFDTQANELQGFSIELMKAIAEKMGKTVEFKDMDFAGLIPAVTGDRIDAAIASLTKTEERLKSVDFSDPYYKASGSLLVNVGSTVKTSKDFAGKKIGVQLGTSYESTLKDLNKESQFEIVSLNKVNEVVQELKNKRIDVAFFDKKAVDNFAKRDKNLMAVPVEEFDAVYAIALKKGSPYREDMNKAIAELEKSGKIEELASKWLKLDR